MPAQKLRHGRKEYGVEDETGSWLIEPSPATKGVTRVAAKRLAERRGENVYLIEVGADRDGSSRIVVDREEIRPTAELPKSRAKIKREVDTILARKLGGILSDPTRNRGTDRPMADPGLISYRLRSPYGTYIMIGARDDDDALQEAARSTPNPDPEALEVWNGDRYVKVFSAGRRVHSTKFTSARIVSSICSAKAL